MIRQIKKLGAIVAGAFTFFAASALPPHAIAHGAETPSAMDIVYRSEYMAMYQGQDGKAQVMMTITDAQGRVRERKLTILRKDMATTDALAGQAYRGAQKFYVYFHRPADVAKMVFMVHKSVQGDDDRWLYLPALDLVKRIAATDKRTSFVGSDFFYEDVSGRNPNADNHQLLGQDGAYYHLKHTPKTPEAVEFAYYESYIHKDTFLPIQVVYYDRTGAKLRTITALDVQTIAGHPTVMKARAENHQTGSATEMAYGAVAYDVGLEDDLFTERYLRNAPRRQLR